MRGTLGWLGLMRVLAEGLALEAENAEYSECVWKLEHPMAAALHDDVRTGTE